MVEWEGRNASLIRKILMTLPVAILQQPKWFVYLYISRRICTQWTNDKSYWLFKTPDSFPFEEFITTELLVLLIKCDTIFVKITESRLSNQKLEYMNSVKVSPLNNPGTDAFDFGTAFCWSTKVAIPHWCASPNLTLRPTQPGARRWAQVHSLFTWLWRRAWKWQLRWSGTSNDMTFCANHKNAIRNI